MICYFVINAILPQPNSLPKTKYAFMKIINDIIPNSEEIITKHRICENCSEYISKWDKKIVNCPICNSSNVNGIFVEYDPKFVLKNAFENRKLKKFMDIFNKNYKIE